MEPGVHVVSFSTEVPFFGNGGLVALMNYLGFICLYFTFVFERFSLGKEFYVESLFFSTLEYWSTIF